MWAMLLYSLPFVIVVIANLGVRRRGCRLLTYMLLGLLHTATLLVGLVSLAVAYSRRLLTEAPPSLLQQLNSGSLGLMLVVTAVLGFVSLAPSARRSLAKSISIDPTSPVHATALSFLIYLAIPSAGLLLIGQDLIRISMEAASLAPETVTLGQAFFLLIAVCGVGLGIRRSGRETLARLGLRALKPHHLVLTAVVVGAFLILDYATAWLWHRLWPASYLEVKISTQQLFAPFATPSSALAMALSAGIGEEILFRGALQPRFRIPVTAAVFALGHVQYALSPAVLEIFIVGLILGWVRQKSNTTTCIAIHATYNFVDVLLLPFFP